jgi:hypothetical protein
MLAGATEAYGEERVNAIRHSLPLAGAEKA